jgi:hypothetical protein
VTKIRIAYACLLSLAAALPLFRWWDLEGTNWTPLVIEYPGQSATIAPTEFTVDRDGVYELVLKIARPSVGPKRDLAECLMGWDWDNQKWGHPERGPACQVAPVIALDWRLSTDGKPPKTGLLEGIADGGGFSNDEADRRIAAEAFRAKGGQRFRFEGRTFRDATQLAFARPRIVVQPTGTNNEDEIVATLGYWAGAALAGLLGMMLLIRDVWASWRHAV